MLHSFSNGRLNASALFRIFKQILAFSICIGLLVYVTLRIIFFDIDFNWMEESVTIAKILLTGGAFATGICGLLLLADVIQYTIQKARLLQPGFIIKRITVAAVLLIIAISASNAQTPLSGNIKDKRTGITTIYKDLKPGKVYLVMNNEVLHHTDIPIGESFLLVNSGIKGLVERSGKVSVGCSLLIKNKNGKTLLKEDDLFKGKDVLDKSKADYLKCTISTGDPMKWEEKYDVTVIFWDKYGKGKIENKVTIRCIDIP